MKCLFLLLLVSLTSLAQQGASRPAQFPPCSLGVSSLVVKLLSPISTVNSNVGDTFTASTLSPDQWKDSVVEGRVIAIHRPEKGLGKVKPSIQMEFSTLTSNGRSCSLTAELKDVTNSQGVAHVDEEGQAIGRSSNKKRVMATAGGVLGGALIGALRGGAGGAVVGGVAGGATGFVLSSTLSSTASNINFKAGSLFTLGVHATGGHSRS